MIINAELSVSNVYLDASVQSNSMTINAEFDSQFAQCTEYTGTYTSDCKFVQQTFPTKDKRMTDDFKVNAIRVAETVNPQGGKTVFIGL